MRFMVLLGKIFSSLSTTLTGCSVVLPLFQEKTYRRMYPGNRQPRKPKHLKMHDIIIMFIIIMCLDTMDS